MAFKRKFKRYPKTTVHSNLTSVDLTPGRGNSNNTFMTPKCETKLRFTSNSKQEMEQNNHTLKAIVLPSFNNSIGFQNKEVIKLNSVRTINSNNANSPLMRSCNASSNNSSQSLTYPINQAEVGLREFIKSNKKKFLERVCKGPSDSFRWVAWMISADIEQDRKNEFYLNLLSKSLDEKTDLQIKKDLNRTLTDEKLFSIEMTKTSLYNVLKAYAICDKEVSYCQGMNFIAAFLLIVSDFNEIDTLYIMMYLFMFNKSNLGIRGFFMNNFPLLNLYTYQFNFLFEKYFPNLKKHFDNLEIPNELWISKWFQTLFTICLPLDILVRLWDCIFVKGLEFLFNFSLSLIKVIEKDLTEFDDIADISEYFKSLNPYANNKNSSTGLKLNIEVIIRDALHIKISKSLLKNLKLEYEEKFKIDLSFLYVTYDIRSLYNSTNSNKENIELFENEIMSPSCKSLPQIKFEIKSKFKINTNDVIQEEELKKSDSDLKEYQTCPNFGDDNDFLNEDICSEFEINDVDVINNVKMHTLKAKCFEEDKKKRIIEKIINDI